MIFAYLSFTRCLFSAFKYAQCVDGFGALSVQLIWRLDISFCIRCCFRCQLNMLDFDLLRKNHGEHIVFQFEYMCTYRCCVLFVIL